MNASIYELVELFNTSYADFAASELSRTADAPATPRMYAEWRSMMADQIEGAARAEIFRRAHRVRAAGTPRFEDIICLARPELKPLMRDLYNHAQTLSGDVILAGLENMMKTIPNGRDIVLHADEKLFGLCFVSTCLRAGIKITSIAKPGDISRFQGKEVVVVCDVMLGKHMPGLAHSFPGAKFLHVRSYAVTPGVFANTLGTVKYNVRAQRVIYSPIEVMQRLMENYITTASLANDIDFMYDEAVWYGRMPFVCNQTEQVRASTCDVTVPVLRRTLDAIRAVSDKYVPGENWETNWNDMLFYDFVDFYTSDTSRLLAGVMPVDFIDVKFLVRGGLPDTARLELFRVDKSEDDIIDIRMSRMRIADKDDEAPGHTILDLDLDMVDDDDTDVDPDYVWELEHEYEEALDSEEPLEYEEETVPVYVYPVFQNLFAGDAHAYIKAVSDLMRV